ncbi:hypothetical protein OHA71_29325 [Streptomyces sp. NBC_00444]|uniref:hypothetical protein n=1 Tax=Streptomyces sp. NBC_00444 TaxID=2975744 RepID=UPI002E1B94C8
MAGAVGREHVRFVGAAAVDGGVADPDPVTGRLVEAFQVSWTVVGSVEVTFRPVGTEGVPAPTTTERAISGRPPPAAFPVATATR